MTPEAIPSMVAWLPVFARVVAFVFTAPVLSSKFVPIRFRVLIAGSLSLIAVPMSPATAVSDWFIFFSVLVSNLLIGVTMGLTLRLLVSVGRMAGSLIDTLCGFAFGSSVFSEMTPNNEGPLAKLFHWTVLATFVAAGGLNQIVDGLVASMTVLPTGEALMANQVLSFVITVLSQSFSMALAAALPAIIAVTTSSIVLGVVQRTIPQLGGLPIEMNARGLIGILAASLLLLTIPWIVSDGIQQSMQGLGELVDSRALTGSSP